MESSDSSRIGATGGSSGAERNSTTVAPKEEMEQQHKEMAADMFDKITEYLNGELASKFLVLLLTESVACTKERNKRAHK